MASVRAFSSQSTKWKYSAYWRLWVAIRRPQKKKTTCNQEPVILGLFLSGLDIIHCHTQRSLLVSDSRGRPEAPPNQEHLELSNPMCCQGVEGGLQPPSPFPLFPPYLPFDSRLHSPALEPQVALLCRCWRYLQIRTCSWTPRNGELWVTTWAWGMAALAMAGRVAGRPGLCAFSGVYRPEPSCGAVHPQSCWPSREQHIIGRNPLLPSLILQGIFKPYLK